MEDWRYMEDAEESEYSCSEASLLSEEDLGLGLESSSDTWQAPGEDVNHGAFRLLDDEQLQQVREESRSIAAKIRMRRRARQGPDRHPLDAFHSSASDSESSTLSHQSWSSSSASPSDSGSNAGQNLQGHQHKASLQKRRPNRRKVLRRTLRAETSTGIYSPVSPSTPHAQTATTRYRRPSTAPSTTRSSPTHSSYKPFKARPIPASTLLPKYAQLLAHSEARRARRHQLRSSALANFSAPFKGMQMRAAKQAARRKERLRLATAAAGLTSDTATRSLKLSAAAVQRLRKRQEEKEQRRKSSRERRAKELLAAAQAPAGLERGKRVQKAEERWTFRPAVSGEVPDLDGKFVRWKRRMEAARRARRKGSTRPDVSGLSMFGEEAKEREERRRARREERKTERVAKAKSRREDKAELRPSSRKGPQVVMTKAEELRLAMALKRKEERAKQEAIQRRQEVERAARACAVGKVVRARVRQVERERKATPGYVSLEEAQRKAREKAKAFKQQWKESRRGSIVVEGGEESGGGSRALLIDGSREAARKAQRKRDALVRAASVIERKMEASEALDESEREAVDLDTEPMKP